MNVSLTPELERFVQTKIDAGLYQNASEVVGDGLRLLKEREESKLEELRREISIGLKQAEEGKVAPWSAAETLAKVRERRAASAKKGG